MIINLEKAGNFTVKKYELITYYGMYNNSLSTWNVTKELFLNGSLDLGMGFFSYIPNNLNEFNLCEPLTKLEFVFLIKFPELKIHVSWFGYLKVSYKITSSKTINRMSTRVEIITIMNFIIF